MTSAIAKDFIVPGDSDGDKLVSDEELKRAEDGYKNGEITADQLETIKTIHDDDTQDYSTTHADRQ
jgi:hypothetical protein